MALVILVDRLVFDIILKMYFYHGIKKMIIGPATLIENIMFHIFEQRLNVSYIQFYVIEIK